MTVFINRFNPVVSHRHIGHTRLHRFIRYSFAVFAIVFSTTGNAQTVSDLCERLHGKENCANSESLRKEHDKLNNELNLVYRNAMANLSEGQRKYLRDSQRTWLQFRQLECDARYKVIGPGDSVLLTNSWQGCINDLTEVRVKDIARWFGSR